MPHPRLHFSKQLLFRVKNVDGMHEIGNNLSHASENTDTHPTHGGQGRNRETYQYGFE